MTKSLINVTSNAHGKLEIRMCGPCLELPLLFSTGKVDYEKSRMTWGLGEQQWMSWSQSYGGDLHSSPTYLAKMQLERTKEIVVGINPFEIYLHQKNPQFRVTINETISTFVKVGMQSTMYTLPRSNSISSDSVQIFILHKTDFYYQNGVRFLFVSHDSHLSRFHLLLLLFQMKQWDSDSSLLFQFRSAPFRSCCELFFPN